MKILICGTPGVGKTTISKHLIFYSYNYFNINTLCFYTNSFINFDEKTKSYIVNLKKIEKIAKKILKYYNNVIFDTHIPELIPNEVDHVILLRCDPIELKRRLEEKGYVSKKIKENVEAEFIGMIAQACYEKFGSKVHEILNENLEETLNIILSIIRGRKETTREIDWTKIYSEKNKVEMYFDAIKNL